MSTDLVAGPTRPARLERERGNLSTLAKSWTFLVGVAIVGFWTVCAVFTNAIVRVEPADDNPYAKYARPGVGDYLLGTDRLGRDVFSRVVAGAREIMLIAPAATLLGTVVGVAFGLAMGYFRGWLDTVLSRVIEALISLPVILVALLALTVLEPSRWSIVAVVGFLFFPLVARTVRAAVLSERDLDYVRAAELRGERAGYVMFIEILPNVVGPIVVEFTIRLGYAIFTIAGLAFVGFGSQPGSPEWGRMIAEERAVLTANIWWPSVFPALAVASLVVGVNFISDAVQGLYER